MKTTPVTKEEVSRLIPCAFTFILLRVFGTFILILILILLAVSWVQHLMP